jgi:glycopeptide antibiotics resistance protein
MLTVYAFFIPLAFVLEYSNNNYFWATMDVIGFPMVLFLRNFTWTMATNNWKIYKTT